MENIFYFLFQFLGGLFSPKVLPLYFDLRNGSISKTRFHMIQNMYRFNLEISFRFDLYEIPINYMIRKITSNKSPLLNAFYQFT